MSQKYNQEQEAAREVDRRRVWRRTLLVSGIVMTVVVAVVVWLFGKFNLWWR